ncbi:hypothetical protein VP01_2955g4 [Puccinia sorghi]|uniref:Uncharacterized protein n=1 Tax=Puccinia sorghi TaxID=27349 RepID=A0A0L6V1P6_9BASI|nr:hypothetical protein VP01_2955g4 [Puccinia sorghi]
MSRWTNFLGDGYTTGITEEIILAMGLHLCCHANYQDIANALGLRLAVNKSCKVTAKTVPELAGCFESGAAPAGSVFAYRAQLSGGCDWRLRGGSSGGGNWNLVSSQAGSSSATVAAVQPLPGTQDHVLLDSGATCSVSNDIGFL